MDIPVAAGINFANLQGRIKPQAMRKTSHILCDKRAFLCQKPKMGKRSMNTFHNFQFFKFRMKMSNFFGAVVFPFSLIQIFSIDINTVFRIVIQIHITNRDQIIQNHSGLN